MTGFDRDAATGQQPYEAALCTCGDRVTLHAINAKGQRAECSSSLCGCRIYTARKDA